MRCFGGKAVRGGTFQTAVRPRGACALPARFRGAMCSRPDADVSHNVPVVENGRRVRRDASAISRSLCAKRAETPFGLRTRYISQSRVKNATAGGRTDLSGRTSVECKIERSAVPSTRVRVRVSVIFGFFLFSPTRVCITLSRRRRVFRRLPRNGRCACARVGRTTRPRSSEKSSTTTDYARSGADRKRSAFENCNAAITSKK